VIEMRGRRRLRVALGLQSLFKFKFAQGLGAWIPKAENPKAGNPTRPT
jgi:hypothetical protein